MFVSAVFFIKYKSAEVIRMATIHSHEAAPSIPVPAARTGTAPFWGGGTGVWLCDPDATEGAPHGAHPSEALRVNDKHF